MLMISFFFFKQKTAYEMRISDWSSDVCSSDLHHRGAQRDAGIHRAAGAEVADAAAVDATPLRLQLLDDLHGAHLGRAGDGAGGKAGDGGVHRILARGEPTLDIGDDVHDVAVELDEIGRAHV